MFNFFSSLLACIQNRILLHYFHTMESHPLHECVSYSLYSHLGLLASGFFFYQNSGMFVQIDLLNSGMYVETDLRRIS